MRGGGLTHPRFRTVLHVLFDLICPEKCGIAKLFDCLDDVFEKVFDTKKKDKNETENENENHEKLPFTPKMFEDLRKLSMSMVTNNTKYCR